MYVFMASFSGTHTEGISPQGQGSAASHSDSSVHEERSMPTFQHQRKISAKWSHEEEAILQEGLVKYASESSMSLYVKIAAQLRDKTVRDVALRCRWMTKKEISKRRKQDSNERRSKDRKHRCYFRGCGSHHHPPPLQ